MELEKNGHRYQQAKNSIQEALLPRRAVSRNLVNCSTTIRKSCTTHLQQIEVNRAKTLQPMDV